MTYGYVPIQLMISVLFAIFYATLGYWLLYSRFKHLYTLLFQNKRLITEMRRLLEVFPASVIIRSKNSKPGNKEYYSNKEFNAGIADIRKKVDKLKDIQIRVSPIDVHADPKEEIEVSLYRFMSQREKLIKSNEILETTVKAYRNTHDTTSTGTDKFNTSLEGRIYSMKTIKVNWEGNPNSYMHVFVDLTDMFRLEEAKNSMRCQKLMFTSASHEFRTPLNAILNSYSLITMVQDSSKG